MNDADAMSYLNRTTVTVISIESVGTRLLELSRPPHHPKWPRTSACGAPCRTVLLFSKLNKIFSGYFDPENIFKDNKNKYFLG